MNPTPYIDVETEDIDDPRPHIDVETEDIDDPRPHIDVETEHIDDPHPYIDVEPGWCPEATFLCHSAAREREAPGPRSISRGAA